MTHHRQLVIRHIVPQNLPCSPTGSKASTGHLHHLLFSVLSVRGPIYVLIINLQGVLFQGASSFLNLLEKLHQAITQPKETVQKLNIVKWKRWIFPALRLFVDNVNETAESAFFHLSVGSTFLALSNLINLCFSKEKLKVVYWRLIVLNVTCMA